MKKQYIKPQSKAITVKSMGFLLAGSPDRVHDDPTKRAVELNSRDGIFFDDDEDEREDSMWK